MLYIYLHSCQIWNGENTERFCYDFVYDVLLWRLYSFCCSCVSWYYIVCYCFSKECTLCSWCLVPWCCWQECWTKLLMMLDHGRCPWNPALWESSRSFSTPCTWDKIVDDVSSTPCKSWWWWEKLLIHFHKWERQTSIYH